MAESLIRAHIVDLRKTVMESSVSPEGVSIVAL